ncbi:MAG: glucosyltransferase domain-containing protein [Lachnospiraceae bacterium]|nr:glucosyltransferase domain-containing protein [Lachnospiraceae bacterium]
MKKEFDQCISDIRGMAGVKKWLPVFIICMGAGIFAYSLLMTHQLVNQLDGLWHGSVSYANGHELSIGRWFWRFIDRWRFYLSPDPVTSVISLALFVSGFILLLEVLDIKSRPAAVISTLLFTVNSSVLVSLSYRYMSPTFALSFFFAVLAAFIIIRCKGRLLAFTAAPLAVALMMGLYQADIGCTCLVLLLYISLCLYRNDRSLKELGLFIVRCFISLLLGGILYVILLNINLRVYDVKMDSYNGADSYGPAGMLLNLPSSIKHAYGNFFDYYEQIIINTDMFSGRLYIVIFALLVLCFVYAAVRVFRNNKTGAVLFVLSLVLIPVAADMVCLMAYDAFVSPQMTIPVSMCLPALVCLASKADLPKLRGTVLCRAALGIVLAIQLYGSYIMTVYDQQAMYMGRLSVTEISRQVITELEKEGLYGMDRRYVFVGSPSENPLFVKNDVFAKADGYATFGTWTPTDTRWVVQSWKGFFTHEMGINLPVAGDEVLEAALQDDTVRAMPVFPAAGSIAEVNGVVVIKLAGEY